MPAAADDWRRMGQEQTLMGVTLERRPYAPPSQEGLRAWRSPSGGFVVEGFGPAPPSDGLFAAVQDWEEVPAAHRWDHDHCAFCGATFEEPPGAGEQRRPDEPIFAEGYVTVDGDSEAWICDRCFEDFKDEFGWTLRDSAGGPPEA